MVAAQVVVYWLVSHGMAAYIKAWRRTIEGKPRTQQQRQAAAAPRRKKDEGCRTAGLLLSSRALSFPAFRKLLSDKPATPKMVSTTFAGKSHE
jgi:hypothetical protein